MTVLLNLLSDFLIGLFFIGLFLEPEEDRQIFSALLVERLSQMSWQDWVKEKTSEAIGISRSLG